MSGQNGGCFPLGNETLAEGLRAEFNIGAAVAQRPSPHAPVEVVGALALKSQNNPVQKTKRMHLVVVSYIDAFALVLEEVKVLEDAKLVGGVIPPGAAGEVVVGAGHFFSGRSHARLPLHQIRALAEDHLRREIFGYHFGR